MRSITLGCLLSVIVVLMTGCPSPQLQSDSQFESGQNTLPKGRRQPVLVELFTSEGCSSCPPADRNLAFLATQQPIADAEIITLAFHVDYWDRLGWKDRFSSPLFSQRQEDYSRAFKLSSIYTPQMVVDGQIEFVGSNSGKAATAITTATEAPKASIEVQGSAGKWQVKITGAPVHAASTVYAAIAEGNLSTRVDGGENAGRTLEHISVVRELKTLGTLAFDKSDGEFTFEVKIPTDSKVENLSLVVFVQEAESLRVIGVGRSKGRLVVSKSASTIAHRTT